MYNYQNIIFANANNIKQVFFIITIICIGIRWIKLPGRTIRNSYIVTRVPAITDNPTIDDLLINVNSDDTDKIKVVKGILELKLPKNINEMPLEDIVLFRNKGKQK